MRDREELVVEEIRWHVFVAGGFFDDGDDFWVIMVDASFLPEIACCNLDAVFDILYHGLVRQYVHWSGDCQGMSDLCWLQLVVDRSYHASGP